MPTTLTPRNIVFFADDEHQPRTAQQPAPPKLAHVDGVDLFDVGQHNGDEYGPADIDELIRNFQVLSTGPNPPVPVPVVLGHDEDQEILKRDDLPAAGWLTRVYEQGSKLCGDFSDIVPAVADLINQRGYRRVSVEINPCFELNGNKYGKVLWRVGLLGAAQPAVKSLKDIPRAQYAHRPAKTILLFSDVRKHSMDRNQMLDALKQLGFDVSKITDAVPDECLAEMLRLAGNGNGAPESLDQVPPAPDGQFSDDNVYKGDGTYCDRRRMDDADSDGTAMPRTDAGADSDVYRDGRTLRHTSQNESLNAPGVASPAGAGHASQSAPAVAASVAGVQDPKGMPMPQPRSITRTEKTEKHTFAALNEEQLVTLVSQILDGKLQPLAAKQREIEQQANARLASERRSGVLAFCDRMVKGGKLLPTERPKLEAALLAASTQKVLKFGHGADAQTKSQFDLLTEAIESRPPILRFAEMLEDPAKQPTMAAERKNALLGRTPLGKIALARQAK